MNEAISNEEELRARRRERLEEMRRNKEKQLRRRKALKRVVPVTAGLLAVGIVVTAGVTFAKQQKDKPRDEKKIVFHTGEEKEYASIAEVHGSGVTKKPADNKVGQSSEAASSNTGKENTVSAEHENQQTSSLPAANMPQEEVVKEEPKAPIYSAKPTENTLSLSDEVVSNYALLIDLDSGDILARKGEKQIINPASMTKILTVLVAAEHVTDLDDTFTMTIDITDYSFQNDCSNAGFLDGEVITVRDLFYGTVLPSGGDAAVGLATYVAGSHEAFVELMNEKLEELGLSETAHVTNCVGLYDEEHYCTAYDMAMILEAALENEWCREVLSAHTYTTSATEQHPEGILLSNWFLRRIEDKDTGGEVICAKTGYVNESGSCAASYAIDKGGKEYICVTADSTSSWRCIYDHVALYKQFATGDTGV